MLINFIGCGKMGKTLAKLLTQNHLGDIGGVLNTSLSSALTATQFIGAGQACTNWQELPAADIYFITTPDDVIADVVKDLFAQIFIPKHAIIAHCSGVLSSDVLNVAKQYACYNASISLLKSFALADENLMGTFCGLEGDAEAVAVLHKLFTGLGAKVFTLNKAAKSFSHIGSVLASNYLVALHHQALQCYLHADIAPEIAQEIVNLFMQNGLRNLSALDHVKALTGPLQRGDAQTVFNHTKALADFPLLKEVYASLGKATLSLTQHDESKKMELAEILKNHP